MSVPVVAQEFVNLEERTSLDNYNFNHFRTAHLLQDAKRTISKQGIEPGALAPDFELLRADGQGSLRLSELRGWPVVVHFGSLS
ncbi:MAG: hypothetical protein H0T45_08970 [Pyrinomonadaceae bacterium]|nr:hypothetical protein [Pyrinomonadaceae bacterium]